MSGFRTNTQRAFYKTTSRKWPVSRLLAVFLRLGLLVSLLTACQEVPTPNLPGISPSPQPQTVSPSYPQAEITFDVDLPAPLEKDQSLFIEFLDEVTGLALNPARVRMEATGSQSYLAKVPFPAGSVIKYRYLRDMNPIGEEYNSLGQQVRYRLYSVDGPGAVRDTITAWKSQPTERVLGRIQGQVAFRGSNAPVVNALVTAGGMHTLTSSDGSFLIEGLPAGTHNMVVYSLDGSFRPFQQGAVVAPESTTPAFIQVDPAPLINLTFIVTPPKDSPAGMPVRMVGGIYQLGNTFADLNGGMSVIASRAPLLALLPDGRYSITLKLPSGLDLRYKYTLGDGFWNAERKDDGSLLLRQLIVPNRDTTIEETITTWKTPGFEPISFTVAVPDNTPASDVVSIQFNPFGWTQPIPMWQTGKNQWFYLLYGPLNVFKTASYRYCRNDQCGSADSVETRGPVVPGKPFTPADTTQELSDTVQEWAWLDTETEPVIVPGNLIAARADTFQVGHETMSGYHPSWQPYIGWGFKNMRDIGANAVVLTPTWGVTHKLPPVIEPVPGSDPLWNDLTHMITMAQQSGLSVTVRPVLRYSEPAADYWQTAARSDGWWQSWFDRYATFVLYHADLAAQTGASALVLGDETILPALPGGTLSDGTPSGVPGDADLRWQNLITQVRTRYTGKLVWFLPYAGKMPVVPDFIGSLDFLYVQLMPPIFSADQPSITDLEASIAAYLDTDILKLQETTNQPIILGLQYPSVKGAQDGCVDTGGQCLDISAFRRSTPEYPGVELSLKEQVDAYSAALSVLNQRSWISGFFAQGYNPAVELRDLSTSLRSKPASDVLWYWFPRLTGQVTP